MRSLFCFKNVRSKLVPFGTIILCFALLLVNVEAENCLINSPSSSSVQVRKIAVIIGDFSDNKSGITPEQALKLLQLDRLSVNEVFKLESWGQLQFDLDADKDTNPDIFGPYRLPYAINPGEDQIAQDLLLMHKNKFPSFNPDIYDHITFFIPSMSGPGHGGLADRGGKYIWLAAGSGDDLYNNVYSWVHELGHNLGLGHSGVDLDNNGCPENREDGDYSSLMTMFGVWFNGREKFLLNWVSSTSRTLTSPGSYSITLSPIDSAPTCQTQVIRIQRATESLYLSYHSPLPITVEPEYPINKLTIHRDGIFGRGVLLAAIAEGESFSSAWDGMIVRVLKLSSSSMDLQIDLAPGVFRTPSCTDLDADGVLDSSDNCPGLPNADQANGDRDSFGDACDCAPNDNLRWLSYAYLDSDRDGYADNAVPVALPTCTGANMQAGYIGTLANGIDCAPNDSTRYVASAYKDQDGDGFRDELNKYSLACFGRDNVPLGYTILENFGLDCAPTDSSKWREYAYCDNDLDGVVGVMCKVPCFGTTPPPNTSLNDFPQDNCPDAYNPSQSDTDQDGSGDACDPDTVTTSSTTSTTSTTRSTSSTRTTSTTTTTSRSYSSDLPRIDFGPKSDANSRTATSSSTTTSIRSSTTTSTSQPRPSFRMN